MIYTVDTHPSNPAISAAGVTRSFGPVPVLRGVDLEVPAGEVLGLLGANGAGKSTLIRILTGLLGPDGGVATVDGLDVVRDRAALGAHIGLAPQELGLYPQLTARQNLAAFARIAGVPRSRVRGRVDELLELLDLAGIADRAAGRLSGGQKRRLHTGIALVHRPHVLFLDEPTVGADVPSRAGILEVVRAMAAAGSTVLYTTHYLPELEQLNARIAVLDEGRITVDGPLRRVVDQWARPSVRIRLRGAPPPIAGWRVESGWLVPTAPVSDPGAALAAVLAAPGVLAADLIDVEVVRADLETAYLAITGREIDADLEVPDVVGA